MTAIAPADLSAVQVEISDDMMAGTWMGYDAASALILFGVSTH